MSSVAVLKFWDWKNILQDTLFRVESE